MFCPNCGCWNPDESINCSTCFTSFQTTKPETVDPVRSVSYAERWHKVAASPLVLILAVLLLVIAVFNIESTKEIFNLSVMLFESFPFYGILYFAIGLSSFAKWFSAAGLVVTYCCGLKKKTQVNTWGIKLTYCGLALTFLGIIGNLVDLVVGIDMMGWDVMVEAYGMDPMMLFVSYGISLLIMIPPVGAAIVAHRSAKTNVVSTRWFGGAAVICYVFAALFLVCALLLDIDELLSIPSSAVLSAAMIGVFALQGVLMSKYKSEMSK